MEDIDYFAKGAMQSLLSDHVSEGEIVAALGISSAEYNSDLHYPDGSAEMAFRQAQAMVRAKQRLNPLSLPKLLPEDELGPNPAPLEVLPAELSGKQIARGWRDTFSTDNPYCPCDLKSFTKAVRWRERAALKTEGSHHGK